MSTTETATETTTLTDRGIRGLKPRAKQFEVSDPKTAGLTLRVLPSGAKRWSFRFRNGSRWGRIALGPYPQVGLADARDLAGEHTRAVRRGGNPSAERRQQRQAEHYTFGALCDRYLEQHAKPRKRSWREDARILRADVPRSWRRLPVEEITRRDVRAVIDAKAQRRPIQANRVRALLHTVFNFALEREIVEYNPVTRTPRPGVEQSRDRVLTEDEIRAFWSATEGMEPSLRAFWRLRLVTAQRAAEVLSMRWSDFEGGWWTVPAEVVKNKRSHRVPLSSLALEILGELPRVGGCGYVLRDGCSKNRRGASARAFDLPDFRGHDLRRTAASYMASAGVPRIYIAKVLNHADSSVTAVYDRHSYDPEKRSALDTWGRKLRAIVEQSEAAAIVPISAVTAHPVASGHQSM